MDKQQEKKSKDKDAPKRKKFSTDDEKFFLPPDKKKLLELKEDPHQWLLEKDDKKLPYHMRGATVYALNDDFYREVNENIGRKLEVGEKVKGRKDDYKVIQVMGRHTYLLKSLTSGSECVMKVEATILPTNGPILIRESFFASNALRDLNSFQLSHFLKYLDRHKITSDKDDIFCGVMMAKAIIPLSEIRAKKLNGNEFSTQTAIRLCMMTLQCIHDVHRDRYVHRDIQPKNFFVDAPDKNGVSSILITGFAYFYDIMRRDFLETGICSTRKLGNTRFLSSVFQPRQYHTRDDIVTFSADLESWIFMCYDFFNSKALPWNHLKLSERDIFSQKEAFFLGAFDSHFKALRIPALLHCIRRKIYLLKRGEAVDYPFLAFMITKLGEENKVVWTEKFEWQDNKEAKQTSIEETQDEDETCTGESAPSSTHEKPPPAKTKKPGKKARQTQPKSIDMDEEAFKPVRLQSKPSRDDQKLKPAKKVEDQEVRADPAGDELPPKPAVVTPNKKPNREKIDYHGKTVGSHVDELLSSPNIQKKPAKKVENQEANPVDDELLIKPVVVSKPNDKKVANQKEANPVAVIPAKPSDDHEVESEGEKSSEGSNESLSKPPAVVSKSADKKTNDEKGNNQKKAAENAVNEQAPPPLNVAKSSEAPQAKKPEDFQLNSAYFEFPK